MALASSGPNTAPGMLVFANHLETWPFLGAFFSVSIRCHCRTQTSNLQLWMHANCVPCTLFFLFCIARAFLLSGARVRDGDCNHFLPFQMFVLLHSRCLCFYIQEASFLGLEMVMDVLGRLHVGVWRCFEGRQW